MMKPFFVGIAGASGSGKSTISKELAEKFNTFVIDLDDYFVNKKKMPFIGAWRNAELPKNIKFDLLYRHLKRLKSGKSIKSPLYRWKEGKPIKYRTLKSKSIIFVEGNYLLYKKEIRNLINLKIFLDASEKILLKRRIKKTGKRNLEYYKKFVYPYYKNVAHPTKKYADCVIKVNQPINKITRKIIGVIYEAGSK